MIFSDKFKIALEHHEKNNLQDAEKLYLDILKINPKHSDTLFLLGTLYAQKKI